MKQEDEWPQLRLADLHRELAIGAEQLASGHRATAEASRDRRRALLDTEAKVQ